MHPSPTSFVTPHSGNFISHNRALKPPFRTSFTPFLLILTVVLPCSFSHLALFLSSFLSMGPRLFVLQIPAAPDVLQLSSTALASRFRIYELLSFFIPPIPCPSLFLPLSSPSDSNAHQRQYPMAPTAGISNCGGRKMHRPLREKRRGVTVKSNHLPRLDTVTCIVGKHDGGIGGNYHRPERSGRRLASRGA